MRARIGNTKAEVAIFTTDQLPMDRIPLETACADMNLVSDRPQRPHGGDETNA
jgi:hypothetical protein